MLKKKTREVIRLREELRQLQNKEKHMARWQKTFGQTGQLIRGAINLDTLLQGVTKSILDLSGFDRISIFAYQEKEKRLHRLTGVNLKGKIIGRSHTTFSFDPIKKNTEFSAAIHSPDGIFYTDNIWQDKRISGLADRPTRFPARTSCLAAVALHVNKKLAGVIVADNALNGRHFFRESFLRLRPFFDQIAVILENQRLYNELERRIQIFSGLININRQLISVRQKHDRLPQILNKAGALLQSEGEIIFMPDPKTNTLTSRWVNNRLAEIKTGLGKIHLRPRQEIIGKVASTGRPAIINGTAGKLDFIKNIARKTGLIIHSFIAAPLYFRDKTTGVLMIINKKRGAIYSPGDLECLQLLAGQLTVAIDNQSLYHNLRRLYFETVLALVRTIEIKAPHLRGHSENVTRYSQLIGEELGLNNKQMETLSFSALLHDIGKIGVPDSVLAKRNHDLTSVEKVLMENHPILGVGILREIKGTENILPGVESHHENWNGNGYPQGLRGKKIPLFARILRLANDIAFHTGPGHHGKPLSTKKMLEILRKLSGVIYDPDLVKILAKVIKHKKKRRGPLDYYLDDARST